MGRFELHTVDTAPEGSKGTLQAVEDKDGFAPNLMKEFAGAPAALKGYVALSQAFEESSLSPAEQQLVLVSAAVENECHYCVAVHSAGALQAGAPEQAVEAVRSGDPVEDQRLDALRRFTQEVTARRGWVGEDAVQAFLDAGYEQSQVLEVITGIALKTLSNYTNHIGQTPLDDAFQDFAWEGEREVAGV